MSAFNRAVKQVQEWIVLNQSSGVTAFSDLTWQACQVSAHKCGIFQKSYDVWNEVKRLASGTTPS